jgi:hypothetical protein
LPNPIQASVRANPYRLIACPTADSRAAH